MSGAATSMGGMTCLVTGATSGIGYETALGLARAGARVGIVGRDPRKVLASAASIREAVPGAGIDDFVADLSSQAETRRLIDEVRAAYDRLDVLVNNAGAIFDRHQTTVDGIERTWALDHLAYMQVTLGLLDLLKASAPARVVNVASRVHMNGAIDLDDIDLTRSYSPLKAYSQAKLGNVVFTAALARRLAGSGVTANSLHPGVVATGFAGDTGGWFGFGWKLIRPFLIAPSDGAATSLHLATSPQVDGISGRYFAKCRPVQPSAAARDEALQEKVWALSLRQLGLADAA